MHQWPRDVMMLFDTIVSKMNIIHNLTDMDINDVIDFKLKQYKKL